MNTIKMLAVVVVGLLSTYCEVAANEPKQNGFIVLLSDTGQPIYYSAVRSWDVGGTTIAVWTPNGDYFVWSGRYLYSSTPLNFCQGDLLTLQDMNSCIRPR